MTDVYNVKQAARLLGRSEETVRRWIRTKRLRTIQPVPRAPHVLVGEDVRRLAQPREWGK